MSITIFDPVSSGAAGDMLIAALLDYNGSKVHEKAIKIIETELIKKDDDFSISIDYSIQNSFQGCSIDVNAVKKFHPKELKEIALELATILNLDEITHDFIVRAFDLLIRAEATVHGVSLEKVHFHELATLDTCFDIVMFAYLAQMNKFFTENKPYILPISVGGGTVKTSHGLLSVPAPATSEIIKLSKLPIRGGPIDRELLTPTGATILGSLKANHISFLPNIKIEKIGCGFGKYRESQDRSILRILEGNLEQSLINEDISIIETNIDDISGETLGYLFEVLYNTKFVKDVSLINTITKKNRPGYLIRVIIDPKHTLEISKILISELGTLGVRVIDTYRHIIPRHTKEYQISDDSNNYEIRIKKGYLDNKEISSKIEFEDLKELAKNKKISLREARKIIESSLFGKKDSK